MLSCCTICDCASCPCPFDATMQWLADQLRG
jgi:hypothetical protein